MRDIVGHFHAPPKPHPFRSLCGSFGSFTLHASKRRRTVPGLTCMFFVRAGLAWRACFEAIFERLGSLQWQSPLGTDRAKKEKKVTAGGKKKEASRASIDSTLMGSLAKGFFAESLRKFCGKFAEICRKYVLLRQERVRKFCGKLRKFRGKLRKIFCNDPFPNDPISELLIQRREEFQAEERERRKLARIEGEERKSVPFGTKKTRGEGRGICLREAGEAFQGIEIRHFLMISKT